jgi:hypothetical protein
MQAPVAAVSRAQLSQAKMWWKNNLPRRDVAKGQHLVVDKRLIGSRQWRRKKPVTPQMCGAGVDLVSLIGSYLAIRLPCRRAACVPRWLLIFTELEHTTCCLHRLRFFADLRKKQLRIVTVQDISRPQLSRAARRCQPSRVSVSV